jgi:tetratricopeptide (TPR) repeat protein
LDRLEEEHDNLRAALTWCGAEKEGAAAGLQLAEALGYFWLLHGHVTEGRRWLASALERAKPLGRTLALAQALRQAGGLAFTQRDFAAARPLHEESLAIARELPDNRLMAIQLVNLGLLAYNEDQHELALDLYNQALTLLPDSDITNRGIFLNNIARVLRDQKRFDEAGKIFEESSELLRSSGCPHPYAMTLYNLGIIAWHQGEFSTAHSFLKRAILMFQELQHDDGIARCLEEFAATANAERQLEKAARLFGAAEVLRESIACPIEPSDQAHYNACVAALRRAAGQEAFDRGREEGRRMAQERAVAYALER